ncbi:ATP-binding protein [Paenibacillus sp. FSL M7-0420]|uniref:ATP-binding protein n=1 Tax=Paenibacillus sp. FSL M7-0420 TaxID=2921609 RepID=UPI0030F852B6
MESKKERYIFLKGRQIKAEYIEQIVEAYQGNPFIEALPPRFTQDQLYQMLDSVPRFSGNLNELDLEDRIELIQQIKPGYWKPLITHFERYRNIYNMIKIGYQSRNPLSSMYQREMAVGLDNILAHGTDEYGRNLAGNIQTAQMMADIGLSGMGKTKSYERILSLFPQVILHKEYKGEPFPVKQVIWLHIECPSNKSVGALCRNFYWAVDKLLGSNYYEELAEKDGRAEVLAKRMAKVAGDISLGALFIDEVQRVHKGHSGGEEKMIDFITELTNSIGIPIVLIGTFKALYLFKTSLANTRRGIPDGYAENITDRMKDDLEWDMFIEGLWELQYTKTYTASTSELKAMMYYHTLGIPNFAVKLFMHVQCRAILYENDEIITAELIEKVANKTFRLVQPIFELIRGGVDIDPREYDDLKPDWITFKEYLKDAQHRITIDGHLSEEHRLILLQHNRRVLIEQLVTFAMKMGCTEETALTYAEKVELHHRETGNDMELLYLELAKLVFEGKSDSSKQNKPEVVETKRRQVKNRSLKLNLEIEDLRFIVAQGKLDNFSVDEALRNAGVVGDFDEFL